MLIKYQRFDDIYFEDFNYNNLQDQIIKEISSRYPTDDFMLEEIQLYGDKYYDVDKGDLFTGQAVVKIIQTIPYGQKPQDDRFDIEPIF